MMNFYGLDMINLHLSKLVMFNHCIKAQRSGAHEHVLQGSDGDDLQ